jgi:UDP-N-acetylmuramoyl-tripeptide--D-alanyl-D-alanine ligase
MVDPDVGVLTNVRAVHMAFFATLDDVAAAKGEMFAVLRDEATAVVNLDDAHVRVQAARHVGPRVTFGQHAAADLRLERIENRLFPGAALTLRHRGESFRVQLRMAGAHSAMNALAALATVVAVGEDLHAAAERIGELEAGAGRGRVHRIGRGIVLVDESYNCSPPALASVLDTMRSTEATGRKVLALGDMLELGPLSGALHREAGRRAAAAGIQLLVAVGAESKETAEAARRAGIGEVHHHADSVAAAREIPGLLRDGDLVVIKGSHGIRMDRLVSTLLGTPGEEA